ncbi:TPA: hypothetical protein HA278_07370 [Candidatus Woesearchaeota archaeon]|nr:hypothetical protein [Candidatus Woesearchaeota archaeon]
MNENQYALGEALVNRNNLKMGNVVNSAESQEGITESVEIKYADGTKEWVSVSDVSRLLLEVDPKVESPNLFE